MLQAPLIDGVVFDPFSLLQDLVATPEVEVSGCQVLKALVISMVVIVIDEASYLAF